MSWCKLHSQSVKSDVFQDVDLWRFWCYLLMRTSRTGNSFTLGRHMVHVEAGQCVIGRKQAAIDCGTTEQRIRTMLKRLEIMGNLTIKPTKIATTITICNWGSYQSTQPSNQPSKQPATNQQSTNDQPLSRSTKRKKKEIEPIVFPSEWMQDTDFQGTWAEWTKHRKELKKDLTPSTTKAQLKKMNKLGKDISIDMMERSIGSGWVGLFEPDGVQKASLDRHPTKANCTADGKPIFHP